MSETERQRWTLENIREDNPVKWETRGGKEIPIPDLSDGHLENILEFIDRRAREKMGGEMGGMRARKVAHVIWPRKTAALEREWIKRRLDGPQKNDNGDR